MFVYSLKIQNLKLCGALILSAIAVVLIVTLIPGRSSDYIYPDGIVPAVKNADAKSFRGIDTNDARIAFLKGYGWEVEKEAREVVEVTIPEQFDTVYNKYNELQSGEGLNLEKYCGKTVKRYTYIVTNYDYNGTVFANLLIYKDQVIGGDICSANIDGFVHGFTKGNDFLTN